MHLLRRDEHRVHQSDDQMRCALRPRDVDCGKTQHSSQKQLFESLGLFRHQREQDQRLQSLAQRLACNGERRTW